MAERSRAGGQGRRASGGRRDAAGRGAGRTGSTSGRGRGGTEPDPTAQLAGPLRQVLERLPQTQRDVLEWRTGLKDGHPHDLADTARQLGLSLTEAREIERRAFDHIREVAPPRLHRLLEGR